MCTSNSNRNLHQQLDDRPPTQKSNIRTGVRQGDTISPKLFTVALENIFRRLTWETTGLKIDGEYLSHLCFADNILMCANAQHELQMLQEFADESENQGLKMNKSKTKAMIENDTPMYVNNTQTENVESYTSTWDRDTAPEIKKTRQGNSKIVTAGWTAFPSTQATLKGNIGTCLKRQAYNSCVLPAMTYGAETWTLTSQAKYELTAAQTRMERSMLNITYRDQYEISG